jgi:hypothetical protein
VSDPAAPALDPARAFGALSRFEVEFVLVGCGLAAQARGATRLTKDLDICPAWTTENLERLALGAWRLALGAWRLALALRQLGARSKIGEGSIDTLAVALDAKTISNLEIGAWRTVAGGARELRRLGGRHREPDGSDWHGDPSSVGLRAIYDWPGPPPSTASTRADR